MRLVMDLVVNHTSDEHPWFTESRSSRDNPKRDWYWWRDARPGTTPGTPGAEPTNWESFFSGPCWAWDEATGQYYLHLFSRKQPDLNWENPEVRQAIYAMMRWWLDRGVDGFRMDVIDMISKDTSLPDTRPRPGSRYGFGGQYFLCGPRNHEFLQEMYREVFVGRDAHVLTVGEMPGVTIAEAALFTAPARRELDMVFQFEHVELDYGVDRYHQGDELGLANMAFTQISDLKDIQTLNYYAEAAARGEPNLPALLKVMSQQSRDQARTPVQWDSSPGAGFSTGTPWMAINPDHTEVNAAAEVGQPGSVFEHYRQLIELRHADPVITDGAFELLLPQDPAIWAFLRRGQDAELLVAANFSAGEVSAALPLDGGWADAAVVLSSLTGQQPLAPLPGLRLRPWESVIWRRAR
jgi:glycosidase